MTLTFNDPEGNVDPTITGVLDGQKVFITELSELGRPVPDAWMIAEQSAWTEIQP